MLENYIGREDKRQATRGTADPALAPIPPEGGHEINELEKSKGFEGFEEFKGFKEFELLGN